MRVFLISVWRGLEEARGETANLIRESGHDVIQMEVLAAEPELALDVCLRELAACDLVVLAVGPQYGSVDPESGRAGATPGAQAAVVTNPAERQIGSIEALVAGARRRVR